MPEENAMIEALRPHNRPLSADDSMAEAGRIILLRDFMVMLAHEAGAQTGADIEDVHEMRVSTRRMRSALRLLEPYYKAGVAAKFRRSLSDIADVLGDIRDRDVLLDDLTRYLPALTEAQQAELRSVMQLIEGEREAERADLHELVDKRRYARFIERYHAFLTTPGAETLTRPQDDVAPTLVRHVLPTVIYDHLGIVRAYNAVIETAPAPTLHQLRIEFKRLRYAITLFEEVLGSGARAYLKELKTVQDHLGRMQDIATAHALLEPLQGRLLDSQLEALGAYLFKIDEEWQELRAQVPELWKRFDGKKVQNQLTTSVAVL
jgi:CHAD domain-containing protein